MARASNSPSIQRSLNQFIEATANENNFILELSLRCLQYYANEKKSKYHQMVAVEATALLRKIRLSLTQSLGIAHVLSASTHSVRELVYSYVKQLAERQRLTKSRHYNHAYSKALLFEYSNKQRAKTDITETSRTYEKCKNKDYFD